MILSCPVRNPGVWLPGHEILFSLGFNKAAQFAQAIEAAGCGYHHIQRLKDEVLANRGFVEAGANHITALGFADAGKVASAVAEWADGDAIAAHAGYGLDYFCTLDQGGGAGANSILHISRRPWLKSELGVDVVTPVQLSALILAATPA